jgi:hypothetical protein
MVTAEADGSKFVSTTTAEYCSNAKVKSDDTNTVRMFTVGSSRPTKCDGDHTASENRSQAARQSSNAV